MGNASWGRGMRHAVGGWFVTKPPMQLAYQVLKMLLNNAQAYCQLCCSAVDMGVLTHHVSRSLWQ